ncbi:MAG: response regulator [Oscillospiraceae bacterium]|nr:response regulator [Oscillospiraceae bacterium]
MTVTKQQQQAFDMFISGDLERLHSFADYFAGSDNNPREIQRLLMLFNEVDAIYSVVCVNEGWFCSNASSEIRWLDKENTEPYRALKGSGVRDSFAGVVSGTPRFGYYECFTFSNGHKGIIQKSYDRTKVTKTVSLSFYNDKGLSHIVNRDGDILMRPASITENLYVNIFDAIAGYGGQQEKISRFMEALVSSGEGTMTFSSENGELIYTYVPISSVDGLFLVSVVSVNTIMADTDKILQISQTALLFLSLILIICAVFILLVWHISREMKHKDQAIAYQTQLFNIFSTYLSRSTDDMFMMVDQKTQTAEYVSANVERVLGVDQANIVEYYISSDRDTDPEGAEDYYAEVAAMSPGQAMSRRAERINPRTGERKYFLENAYCVDLQGVSKRVYYVSDRTKEHNDRNSLADALQMARAASEAKSSFLSNISHDIRTPMNAITGFLALMKGEVNNPALMTEYIQRIDAASQHLLGLINDVLDMSRIESGSTTLNIAEMNLAEVIDEINTMIRPQVRAKNQIFDIIVSPMRCEHLMGDKMRLNQILINLLSNAVKYTHENGVIQLRVEELPQIVSNYSRIRFTVSDNGLGMSEDYQKIIFDTFTREDTKETHEIQGTGRGMPITKSLVDLMGGSIRLESRLGEGSTFTVELELPVQEYRDDPEFWSNHKVTKMIVADDDEDVCRNIVKIMSKTDVIVDYSTDGGTAVQTMREYREAGHPYDLILLDWKMPGLDGLETARLIRKNYSDKIPILLLTAYDWSDIEHEAKEIGVNHFMPKPFFMSTFKEAIRRVMGNDQKVEQADNSIMEGKHILVVDDIEVNRIILVKILTSLGAVCDTANNGQEAVDAFEQAGEYDLILMDVQMPVMDGYTATKAIRNSTRPSAKTLPIIAMTANAFVDDVREAINSGMDAHIAKPVQIDQLKSTIQSVFEKKKQ